MIRLMIAAASSNSGKTTVTCGLLSLLKKQGLAPCSFKCGPDYIDPMFHRSVLGVDSHNLDLHLAGEERMKEIYARYSYGHDAVVCEGVMGMYDGISADSAEGSAWHTADLLDLPVILVVRPKGIALTLAALVRGLATFRENSHVAGVIINDCSRTYYETYGPAIEQGSGIPVLGYVPHTEEAVIQSRHLGLLTAGEIEGLKDKLEILGDIMAGTIDIERLKECCNYEDDRDSVGVVPEHGISFASQDNNGQLAVRLAVARDAAFNFIYEEGLDALRDEGAEICFFSPLADEHLPEGTSGVYLPGGYPELNAEKLSTNTTMMAELKAKIEEGMPVVAECGGFMYLSEGMEDDKGVMWPMMGLVPGECRNKGKLVRFGYGTLEAAEDTLLISRGETVNEHEFHHWDSTHTGEDLILTKRSTGKRSSSCFATSTVYAGYPHIYFAGGSAAARFVKAMKEYRDAVNTATREKPEASDINRKNDTDNKEEQI